MTSKKTSLLLQMGTGGNYKGQKVFSRLKNDVTDNEVHKLGVAIGQLFENDVRNFYRRDTETLV